MPELPVTRRQTVAALTTALTTSLLPASAQAATLKPAAFTLCLNMSTLRGHKLGLVAELETATKAGFRAVEIWMDTYQTYLKTGSVADLRQRLADLGLTVENAIGFAPWIVDDEATRQKGLDQMKLEMDLLAQIGCRRTAAPPIGAQTATAPLIDLHQIAERYRAIVELGQQTGVAPQLELWGFAKNLSRLSEVMFVAIESGHPSARVLLDSYHLYKGGSSLAGLSFVRPAALDIFHVNDYPATLNPQAITDADRVYPGDGVAPLHAQRHQNPDKPIVLSLEVFNKSYYAQNPLLVAQTAFAKMKAMSNGI